MKFPIYEHHKYDDKFPIIFHYDTRVQDENSPYFPNWHGAIEILYFKNGNATLILNEEKIKASPEDVIVINSDVVHTIVSDSKKCNYYCLIIDKNFIEKSGFPINDKQLSIMPDDPEIISLYNCIINSINESNPFNLQETLGYVYIILSKLYSNYSQDVSSIFRNSRNNQIEIIKKAITYIRENFQSDITLDDISEHCHMSKYYFCRTFSEVTGITAVKYINNVRCEHARNLLSSGEFSVSEISGMCGFESPSYFTKIFKNYCGVTPNSYKNTDRGWYD